MYRVILQDAPSHRGTLLAQIELATAMGDLDAALERCDEAFTQLGKDDEKILSRKSKILLQAGQSADAVSILMELRKGAPPASPVHSQAGRAALEAGKIDEAEKIFSEIRQSDPANKQAILGLVQIAEARGNIEKAMALIEQHIQA